MNDEASRSGAHCCWASARGVLLAGLGRRCVDVRPVGHDRHHHAAGRPVRHGLGLHDHPTPRRAGPVGPP